MSEQEQRAPVAEVVPHQPGCGLKVLPNGRHRAVCVCDDQTVARALLAAAARDAEKVRDLEAEVEKLKALIARNHIAYLRVQGIEP